MRPLIALLILLVALNAAVERIKELDGLLASRIVS
jgi:hypothetical protein